MKILVEKAVIEQALEALIEAKVVAERYQNAEKREKAITALREALAEQAEQEPVNIDWEPLQNFWRNNSSIDWQELESAVKCAVATTVRTKDLTDDEIRAIWLKVIDPDGGDEVMAFARAVIAADREKNK